MPTITPHLWFDNEAEEAAHFYTSVFPNSSITGITHYPEAATEVSGKPADSVLTVDFEIDGQPFVALNGGPNFKFNESISFMIPCKDQAEVDYFWEKLTAGGEESQCGWLKDRFGVSWQVVPERLNELLADADQRKAEAVTTAFVPMKKLEIDVLERAYADA
ncbi:MAG TPA: VOC family protein [Dehalococcoidia bacterium]|nr:VOC family protein [Dehalococcoidia bacterium]